MEIFDEFITWDALNATSASGPTNALDSASAPDSTNQSNSVIERPPYFPYYLHIPSTGTSPSNIQQLESHTSTEKGLISTGSGKGSASNGTPSVSTGKGRAEYGSGSTNTSRSTNGSGSAITFDSTSAPDPVNASNTTFQVPPSFQSYLHLPPTGTLLPNALPPESSSSTWKGKGKASIEEPIAGRDDYGGPSQEDDSRCLLAVITIIRKPRYMDAARLLSIVEGHARGYALSHLKSKPPCSHVNCCTIIPMYTLVLPSLPSKAHAFELATAREQLTELKNILAHVIASLHKDDRRRVTIMMHQQDRFSIVPNAFRAFWSHYNAVLNIHWCVVTASALISHPLRSYLQAIEDFYGGMEGLPDFPHQTVDFWMRLRLMKSIRVQSELHTEKLDEMRRVALLGEGEAGAVPSAVLEDSARDPEDWIDFDCEDVTSFDGRQWVSNATWYTERDILNLRSRPI